MFIDVIGGFAKKKKKKKKKKKIIDSVNLRKTEETEAKFKPELKFRL